MVLDVASRSVEERRDYDRTCRFLSCAFQPTLLGLPELSLDSEAPLKQVILTQPLKRPKIIKSFQHFKATMSLGNSFQGVVGYLAEKCIAVWAAKEEVARLYLDEIIELCLYGPKRIEDITMSGALLANDDFAAQDSYPRALALSFLLRLDNSEKSEKRKKGEESGLAEQILIRLVDLNQSDYNKEYKIHTQNHKRRVLTHNSLNHHSRRLTQVNCY